MLIQAQPTSQYPQAGDLNWKKPLNLDEFAQMHESMGISPIPRSELEGAIGVSILINESPNRTLHLPTPTMGKMRPTKHIS